MRSVLLASPTSRAGLNSAIAARPDALVLDTPAGDRLDGEWVRDAVRLAGAGGIRVFAHLRVGEEPQLTAQLETAISASVNGMVLSGVIGRASVERVWAKLAVLEAEHGLKDGTIRVFASIGSAAGVLRLPELALAGPRLAGLIYDGAGLARDLDIPHGNSGEIPEPLRQLRAMMVLTAMAAGVPAVDEPCPVDTSDEDLAAGAGRSRWDGFAAKLASEPRQVAVIGRAFA